jgi:hypothetical protein
MGAIGKSCVKRYMYKDFMTFFHEIINYVVGGSGPLKATPASSMNSTLTVADGSTART